MIKKKYLLFFLLVLLVVILTACGPNNLVQNSDTNSNLDFKYKIDFILDDNLYLEKEIYDENDCVLPITPKRNGYTFEGWYFDKGKWENPFKFNKSFEDHNIKVYGKFKPIEYSITYKNTMYVDNNNILTFNIDTESFVLNNLEKTGYIFEGWYTDTLYKNKITFINKGTHKNLELYAKWSPIKYHIQYFNTLDADNNNISTYTIESESFVLNNLAKTGYIFEGWYTDILYKNKITSINKGEHKNLKLYAKWSPIKYHIQYFNTLDVDNNNISTYTIESNDVNLIDLNKEGYTFKGWYIDSQYKNKITSIAKGTSGNLTLYAKWGPKEYIINYMNIKGAVNSNKTIFTAEDDEYILNNINQVGYIFKGWYTDSQYNNVITSIPTGTNHDLTIYAKWSIIEYNITYENTYGVKNTNVNSYNVEDKNIVLNNISRSEYIFDGWYLDNQYQNKINSIVTGTYGDLTLYAKWKPVEYKISYRNIKDSVNINKTSFTAEDDEYILNNINQVGYIFKGWYTDSQYNNVITSIPTGTNHDLILYAKWDPIEYTINYINTKGAVNNNKTKYTIDDSDYVLTKIEKPGYLFAGWYEDALLNNKIISIPTGTIGGLTIYAKWEVIEYTISYMNTKDVYNYNKTTYTVEDEEYLLSNLNKTGYIFDGWYLDNQYQNKINSIVTGTYGDLTLYAKWGPKEYTINYINTKGAVNNNKEIITIDDSEYVLSNISKEGYVFEGWYTDSAYNDVITCIPAGYHNDLTIYAKWKAVKYNIMYQNTFGVENSNVNTYTIDSQEIILENICRDGYIFEGWYTDDQYQNRINKIATGTTGNLILHANWVPDSFLVTYDANGGRVSPSKQYVEYNSYLTLPLPTRVGYKFLGWYNSSGNLVKDGLFTELDAIVLKAHWEIIEYKITYNPNGGVISQNVLYVNNGSYVIHQTPTREGYAFNGWYYGNTKIEDGMYNYVTDITLKAEWVKIYKVTYVYNGKSVVKTVKEGNKAPMPIEFYNGYYLLYYYTDPYFMYEFNINNNSIYQDMTIYIKLEFYGYKKITQGKNIIQYSNNYSNNDILNNVVTNISLNYNSPARLKVYINAGETMIITTNTSYMKMSYYLMFSVDGFMGEASNGGRINQLVRSEDSLGHSLISLSVTQSGYYYIVVTYSPQAVQDVGADFLAGQNYLFDATATVDRGILM